MDGCLDKLPLYRQQLLAFQRKPHKELTPALARLTNLVDKMHPKDVPENVALRDQIFRTTLISLTPDNIAIPLIEDIKKAKANCNPMTLVDIRGVVMAAETKRSYYNLSTDFWETDKQPDSGKRCAAKQREM